MLSINALQTHIGSFEGIVIVRQWNPNKDGYDFEKPLQKIPSESPVRNLPIQYMYADRLYTKGDDNRAALFIEVDRPRKWRGNGNCENYSA